MKKAILTGVAFCSLVLSVFAQQTPEIISSSYGLYTPETLVQNAILGEGITITNITYTGDSTSIGVFNHYADDIGLSEGIVLSTGKVSDVIGVGCPNIGPCANMGNNGTISFNTTGGGDADLAALSSSTFNVSDAAIIEIEFIPEGDSINLNYVFASEEYQNYTCASFNDAMGLFLSGPGISGPFSNNAENIALIPGTNIPVSINSVNSGIATGGPDIECISLDYSQYFVNNITAGFNLEFNGFTTPLSAGVSVVPGETYTLKIAVGDAGDANLDSALFLGIGSFGSNVISTEISYSNPFGSIAEGCSAMDLVLSIEEALDSNLTIPYTIVGDATLGVDFTMTPSVINFSAGTTSTVISINALEDTEIEGIEAFDIVMQIEGDIENIPVSISDPYIDEYSYGEQVLSCDSDTAVLSLVTTPDLTNSSQTFSNDTSFVVPPSEIYYIDIDVTGVNEPTIPSNMQVSVCMNLINSAFIYEAAVWLISPDNKIIALTSFNSTGFIPNGGYENTCFLSTAFESITTGAPPFTGNWLPEGNFNNLVGSPTNGTWRLAITDTAPGFAPTFDGWSITFDNSYYEAEYFWSPQIGLDCSTCAEPVATIVSDMTYYVTITDSYGCVKEDSVAIDITGELEAPVIDSVHVVNEDCDGGAGSIDLFLSGSVSNIEWSTGQDTSFIDGLTAGTYTVTVNNGCGEDTVATYIIEPGLDFDIELVDAPCDGAGSAFIVTDEIYDISWSTGEIGDNISDLETGTYTVLVSSATCNSIETFEIVNEEDCISSISGIVNLELGDDDCISDALTVPSQFRMLSLSGNNGIQYDYTDIDGTYSFDNVELGNYDLTIENYGYNNYLNCPSSATIPLDVSQYGVDYNNNDYWLVKSNVLADLQLSVMNFGTPRPDFTNTAKIYCWNVGANTAEGNTLVFTHEPAQTFIGITSTADITHTYDAATSTVTITLPDMPANDYLIINIDLYIPTTANIGDVYNYYAAIETTSSEENLANNVASTQFDIINSYDPNDKQVQPTGVGETGGIAPEQTELIFTINFQNEGTADALKVVLKDEIDTDVFDFTSIRFLESSHPFEPSVEGNSTLVITYEDINLVPEEESEEGSKGFIIFSIELEEDLPFGTEIKNGADIFFDFNEAIVTNETLNTITDFTSNEEVLPVSFNIFPNPADHKLQLSSNDEIIQVNIINQLGKTISEINDYTIDEPLDIRKLAKGIYFIQVETEDGRKGVRKLTIVR